MTHRLKLSVVVFTSILVINIRLSSTNQTTSSEASDTLVTFIPSSSGYEVKEDSSVAVMLWSTSYTAGDETTVSPILSSSSNYTAVENPDVLLTTPSLSSYTSVEETTIFSITPSLSSDTYVEETTDFSITPSLTSDTVAEETDSPVTSSSSQSAGQDTSVASILPSTSYTDGPITMLSSSTFLISSSSTSDSVYDSTTISDITPSPSSSAYDSTTTSDITLLSSSSADDSTTTTATGIAPSPLSSSAYDSSTTTTTDITPVPSSSAYDSSTTTATDITPSPGSSAYDSITTTDITPAPSSSAYDSSTTTTTDITPSPGSSAYDSTTTTATDITPAPSSSAYDSSTTTTTATDITPAPSSSAYDSSTTSVTTPSSSMTADMTTTSPATPSSSSQSTVTSAVTSASTSTSPPSNKYPPQTPDLEGAVFTFTFGIKGNPVNFTLIWLMDLKPKIKPIFSENLVGFQEVRIQGNLHEKKRRHARSSVEMMLINTTFAARDLEKVDKNVVQQNLTTAMQNVETTLKNFNYDLDDQYKERIASFAALTSDVCNSQSSKGLCGVEYNCTGHVCQHLCKHTYCGGHGQCYVHVFDSKVSTNCQCTSQNPYNYEGVACERAVMKEQYVAAIAVSVFGVVLLVLVVVVVFLCRQVNRKSVRTPHDELIKQHNICSPLDQVESWSYKSLPTKHNQAYSNHGYEPHYMAYRETDPAVYEFRALPRDRSRDSYDVRLREPDLSSFPHVSSERKFSIKRPQVSSQHADPE